ncbi:MAG: RNA pseudouridine synthase [Cryomorphaceae bacterium]|nr:RNA pseudouridine synthase [Cryomorphaceae bacterium]
MTEDESIESEQEDLYEHYRFQADPRQEQIRIDKFLGERLANTSRNKIQIAAREGNILVNGEKVKQNYRVKPGDLVTMVLPYPVRNFELKPQDIPINILHEDDNFVIVNKDAGMVVHPGHGNHDGTLVNALLHHFDQLPELPSDYSGRPGLVHRIDKNTSGLLVVAKTERALTKLAKQFYDKTTSRKYFALVWGDVEHDGTIVGNIARSKKNRKVMAVYPDGDEGKHAVTHFKVVERFGYVTLVECRLETGRTHQIRAHFKWIGHPLFNDMEYGGNKVLKGLKTAKYQKFIENNFQLFKGQALHAQSLGFVHPETGEDLLFSEELPEYFKLALKRFRDYCK